MKSLIFSSLVITVLFFLFAPKLYSAESYYYSFEGKLHGDNPVTYNLTGIVTIEESITLEDGFEKIIYQQSLEDHFPIKEAVLMSDLEVVTCEGNLLISFEWELFEPGQYFNTSAIDLLSSEVSIASFADFNVTFHDENGNVLPLEAYDTLPYQIQMREALYDSSLCHFCYIDNIKLKKLRKVETLPTPDLDQDGDVDGNDLSIFSQSFGSIFR